MNEHWAKYSSASLSFAHRQVKELVEVSGKKKIDLNYEDMHALYSHRCENSS